MTFTMPTINTGDSWTASNHNTYIKNPIYELDNWPQMEFMPLLAFADPAATHATVSQVEGSVATKPSWYVVEYPYNLDRERDWQLVVPDYFEHFNVAGAYRVNFQIWWYGSQQADAAKFVQWNVKIGGRSAGENINTYGYGVLNQTYDADNLSTAAANIIEVYEPASTFNISLVPGELGLFSLGRNGTADDATGTAYLLAWRIFWNLSYS